MIPYSDNIIFMDTEFTWLDPVKGELLSIALVKYTGEELYLEFKPTGDMDPWVTEHVMPYMAGMVTDIQTARQQIRDFVGPDEPYLVSYVNQFDAMFWYKLFGSPMEHPAFWIPLDFASIAFAYGYHPGSMGHEAFYKELGIDKSKYTEHNALGDARMLADVYKSFMRSVSHNIGQ